MKIKHQLLGMKMNCSPSRRLGPALGCALLALALSGSLAPQARAALTHRYSFTTDATDSVGGANGTPQNGATFSGGAAVFSGAVVSGPTCDFIVLPPGLISNYTSVTFEFWINVGANGNWEELYAFGTQTASAAGANMLMFTPHSGAGDFRMSYAQAAPGYNDEHIVTGLGVLDNLGPLQVACVYDPPNNTMTLYTNGAFVNTLSPVTANFSLTNIYNVNSWLGRSLYNGDASYAGSLDEFRIYNTALGGLQIAVDNAAGPDTLVTNIALTSIVWNLKTNLMNLGSFQDTSVTFNTAAYGSISVPSSSEATYSTSDATVATVSSAGRISGVGLGAATVSAAYGNQTNSVVVHVAKSGFGHLTHRYSFTTDASDSIGGADGTLQNGAMVSGGAAVFSGAVVSGPGCDFIELPSGLISGYTSVTFELWVDVGQNGNWEELYAMGDQTSASLGANMVMFCPHSGSTPNDFRMSYAQAAPGYNDEYVVNGVGVLDGLGPMSVACVYDPPNNAMSLYTNGALVGFMSPVTARFSLTNVYDVHSWLGRSLYNGDAAYAGSIDEFRIYDTALGPLQLAVNNVAGPDTVVTNIAVNSIVWNVKPTMTIGSRQDTTVTFNTASYGSFILPGSTEAAYSTSDPAIATVTVAGRIFAMATGSVTVSARYNNQTNNIVLQVGEPVLVNRYSFTSDASDSVGGANGTLEGSATISGGAVVLPGGVTSSDPSVSYVNLPPNLVVNFTAITLETWVTDLGSGAWARIWDLGDSVGGQGVSNGGSRYMFLSLPSGNADLYGGIQVSDRAGGSQIVEWVAGRPLVGQEAQVVWVGDPAHQMGSLYVNGALVAVNTNMTLTPADIGPTVNDWLGRSQYATDAAFDGTIDEFRIWNGALSPLQVAINAAAGPDRVGPTDPGALQDVRLSVNTTLVKHGVQQGVVYGDFASVTNVNVSTLGTTFTSSDPTVLSVDANGFMRGLNAGTATVMAAYSGKSDTKTITVVVAPVTLTHRWSFNETSGTTVANSVGGATATLEGGATLGGGAVTLDGASGYVLLPGHLIDGDSAVTFETWVTVDPNTANDDDSRLFALGSSAATNELSVTANTGYNTSVRYFGPPALSLIRGGFLGIGQELHLVAVFNPPAGTIDLFLNGLWQNSLTNLGFSLSAITDAVGLLGVGLDTNTFTAATFDEFRIYNGALDLFGIRASMAAGPNAVVASPGAPVSLTLKADPMMVLGSRQIPHVHASFASVTNVDLTQTDPVSCSSSDPSVVSVGLDGRLHAMGLGSATITATVSGVNSSATVSVVPKQTMLAHRYSFTADASDSVGAQDGVVFGTASISGNAVVLDGDANNKNSYVDLPSGLVSSFDSVTLEAWVSLASPVVAWARIFDFGNQSAAANGLSYVFLTPHSGTPSTRMVLSDGVAAANEAVLDFTAFTLDGYSGQVAAVYDPPNNLQSFYTNGVFIGSASLNAKQLAGVTDLHCWLGRSLYNADPGLSGSIDEFRIYAGALTASQIAADTAAGPNTVVLPPPMTVGPKLSVVLGPQRGPELAGLVAHLHPANLRRTRPRRILGPRRRPHTGPDQWARPGHAPDCWERGLLPVDSLGVAESPAQRAGRA